MLKLDEERYDANLLRLTLEEVVEARKQLGDFSEVGQQHFEKLDQMLVETGGKENRIISEFLRARSVSASLHKALALSGFAYGHG
jgi:rubrerythrin